MTEGLITSLFKKGTKCTKQTELKSREREREGDKIQKAETNFAKHEPTTASTSSIFHGFLLVKCMEGP